MPSPTPAPRTPFMEKIMQETYSQVAIEAITGGFPGSWERCIARSLQAYASKDHSEATLILDSVNGDLIKAAYLITNSKPKEVTHGS